MLRELFLGFVIDWAWQSRASRGFWRLRRLVIREQLRDAQSIGQNVKVFEPIYVRNAGYIKIGAWTRQIELCE